jgi:hypothetical protein
MKKLLFLFALVIASFSITHAQSATLLPLVAGDTLTNTDTLYKNISVTAGYSVLGLQVNVTKISGTVAGNVVLIGSLDGTNYQPVLGDTVALANTTGVQTLKFRRVAPEGTSYRLLFISSGTQSYVPRIYYVLKKYDH